ncbi:MAG: hypothetical protein ACREIG_03085, partial [Nitrospiraceae bacterium]
MNEFQRCRIACQIGIKAYQSLFGATSGFERLTKLVDSEDHLLLSALFHMAVIKYAKPFIHKPVAYPIKHLKSLPGFSVKVHEHLIKVRHTLIAHDDFEQIEPRILSFGINPQTQGVNIPTSIVVGNKSISRPADLQSVETFKQHTDHAITGVQKKLFDDMAKLREVIIMHPDQAKQAERYSNHCGSVQIPASGARLAEPNFMDDSWLDPKEPDFSSIHNGFRYEAIKLRRNFYGPETIKLPNG